MEDAYNEELARVVRLVDGSGISSIRKIVTGILRIINDPAATAKDLKEIVEVDPPLTGKLLKVANSAYYSPHRQISGIEEAVIWLGFDTLKELALSQKVCEIFNTNDKRENYSRIALWRHSVSVALLGKQIYRMEFGERGETIYAAGVIHDIGIIAIDQILSSAFAQILVAAEKREGANFFVAAEMAVLGFNHADLGMEITREWNFPQEIVSAIGYHNRPNEAPERHRKLAATLYVANYLFSDRGQIFCEETDPDLYQWCIKLLNIEELSLEIVLEDVKTTIAAMEEQGIL